MRPCLTKDKCSSRLIKLHPFTDLKKNTKSLICVLFQLITFFLVVVSLYRDKRFSQNHFDLVFSLYFTHLER